MFKHVTELLRQKFGVDVFYEAEEETGICIARFAHWPPSLEFILFTSPTMATIFRIAAAHPRTWRKSRVAPNRSTENWRNGRIATAPLPTSTITGKGLALEARKLLPETTMLYYSSVLGNTFRGNAVETAWNRGGIIVLGILTGKEIARQNEIAPPNRLMGGIPEAYFYWLKTVTTQVYDVLKAQHNVAHGKAMGINAGENPCPEGATQGNAKRGCVAPTGQKKRWRDRNLGLRPRLGCVVLSAHSCSRPDLSSY